jgi:hypothetical protein
MRGTKGGIVSSVVAMAITAGSHVAAEPPVPPALDPVRAAIADAAEKLQAALELPVRVVDSSGQPIAGAIVTPWALRSSQGHGLWNKGDKRAQLDPQEVVSDAAGAATVRYPRYRHLEEGIRTISVSLQVDHPQFAYLGAEHIEVPLEADGPHVIKLAAGVPLEIRPTIDGAAADLDNLHVLWSDGRSWRQGAAHLQLADGVVRIPAMPPGQNSVLLVKLVGERASHFSKITDVDLVPGETPRIEIPLRPSLRIEGKLSDNVPRPVRGGRLKTLTLAPKAEPHERVSWFSWAPIQADGTFVIDGWPTEEPLQVIALCDGYHATSGLAPDCVKNPRPPEKDPFHRPQVFDVESGEQIEVAMTPLIRCPVKVVDEDDKPVAGVTVLSGPNVGWWNWGSQIYCDPLVRSERLLRNRDYESAADEIYPKPFRAETDAHGAAALELLAGRETLGISSEVYELPVFLGQREMKIKLTKGEPAAEVVLRVQPQGTEKLGEWDKLAGVVFGCSTREGRRICALPAVSKRMDEFARRFREAKSQRDPQLLSEAYTAVADAFVGVGDEAEAAKWRQKAMEQAAIAKNHAQ